MTFNFYLRFHSLILLLEPRHRCRFFCLVGTVNKHKTLLYAYFFGDIFFKQGNRIRHYTVRVGVKITRYLILLSPALRNFSPSSLLFLASVDVPAAPFRAKSVLFSAITVQRETVGALSAKAGALFLFRSDRCGGARKQEGLGRKKKGSTLWRDPCARHNF